jgi:hypothetical protein
VSTLVGFAILKASADQYVDQYLIASDQHLTVSDHFGDFEPVTHCLLD